MLASGLAIAFCIASPAPAAPAPDSARQSAPREQWSSEITVLQTSNDPDRPESLRFSGFWKRGWESWITTEDMPADLRARRLDTVSFVLLETDIQGKPAACRVIKASEDARLDEIACRLLAARASFPIHYERPGRPAPGKRVMAVHWESLDAAATAERARMRAAPAPPAPPPPRFAGGSRPWPRLEYYPLMAPVSLPAIQADYPAAAGRPREGMVSLDLVVSAQSGITGCEVGIGSGNPVLDEAACRVARRLDLRYIHGCDECIDQRLPLQIVWRKRGSHIRLPLPSPYARGDEPTLRDPADTRIATTYGGPPRALGPPLSPADFAGLDDKTHTGRYVRVNLSIGTDGRTTDCVVQSSSGNPAIDQKICQLQVKRARFQPRTDIFGDPVPSPQSLWIDLTTLL